MKDLAVDDSGPPLTTSVHDDPAVLGVRSLLSYSSTFMRAIIDEPFTDEKLF